jgi:GGDEF domain-containing protein
MAAGDLTSSEQAELVLYRAIIALMPGAIALVRASDEQIVWANDRLATILGFTPDALAGQPANIIGEVAPTETFQHPEVGTVWLAVAAPGPTAAPRRGATTLPGRGTFQEDLGREVARAKRTDTPLSIAMLALDGEHDLADPETINRLSTATEAWRGALRECDTIANYAYGELAYGALLPDCPQEVALMVTERARMASQQDCSAGYACWNSVESGFELAVRAHHALRAAQRAGGGRSVQAAGG